MNKNLVIASQGDSGREDIVIYDNMVAATKSKWFGQNYTMVLIDIEITLILD